MPMNMSYIGWAGYDLTCCGEDATASGIGGYGSIQLEFGWQLIAIPTMYGYWDDTAHEHAHDEFTVAKYENYVQEQIDDLYGPGIIEVANTYLGDNQFFWSYVVGSTPTSSPHNFQLVYDDNGNNEISGFWIKVIGPNPPYLITWGNQP